MSAFREEIEKKNHRDEGKLTQRFRSRGSAVNAKEMLSEHLHCDLLTCVLPAGESRDLLLR